MSVYRPPTPAAVPYTGALEPDEPMPLKVRLDDFLSRVSKGTSGLASSGRNIRG